MNGRWFARDNIDGDKSVLIRSSILSVYSQTLAPEREPRRWRLVFAPIAVAAVLLAVIMVRPVALEVSTMLADSKIPIVDRAGQNRELSLLEGDLAGIEKDLEADIEIDAAIEFEEFR